MATRPGNKVRLMILIVILIVISIFAKKIYGENRALDAQNEELKNDIIAEANPTITQEPATTLQVPPAKTVQPNVISQETFIAVSPKIVLPGDPVLITITASSSPTQISLDGKNIPIFTYDGKPRGLIGIDFSEKIPGHEIRVKLLSGQTLVKSLTITPREKITKPLGIPETLGGNTTEASKNLVANLTKENAEINNIITAPAILWVSRFIAPLSSVIVTDNYGYDRKTVDQTIPHKGTDFRAVVGTEVKAMNRGVVRLARTYIVYGNSIIVDHGLGVSTLYMHLSKINVKEGDTVEAGQLIGLSGKTGYADAAHLHISVKIGGISIDPMVFLALFD